MSCSALKCLMTCVAILTPCATIPVTHAAPHSTLTAQAAQLDSAFQNFSSHYYSEQVKSGGIARFSSIEALASAIQHQLEQDNSQQAVLLIFNNLALIEKHINSKVSIQVISILLDTNEWKIASRLFALAQQESDRSVISNMSFFFARQHFYRGRWREALDMLAAIERDLPPEDLHHALLMQGIAAQKLQDHRQAIDKYSKIPEHSRHYLTAQLNMAVANIRQDWWTDAHDIIHKLLKDQPHASLDNQKDRLYTLLGYSFLQQQYYRNSRDAFRNVSLDSPYTNRALLGIALSAVSQEDYVGALNAVRMLTKSDKLELPVDEAHLLSAYFYEKLKQYATASAGYTDAIAYYEQRINRLDSLVVSDADIALRLTSDTDDNVIAVSNELVDLGELLPIAFFDNMRQLWSYQAHMASISGPALEHEFSTLQNEYKRLLSEAVRESLRTKADYLTSYMNQARYGLARMYDNSQPTNPQ